MTELPEEEGAAHPDVEILEATTPFKRYLRVDTFRFRHRLFSGEWGAARNYDVLRRGRAVAIRETREETGLNLIGELIAIQHYLPSCGGSDEKVDLFCGRIDSTFAAGVYGLPEEHEDIRVVVKTLAEIEALLDAGTIESGHTLIALYWLLRHRDHLRQRWAAP